MFDLIEKAGQVILFSLDPEKAHSLSLQALRSGLVPAPKVIKDKRLNIHIAGIDFTNPVGMAAGYDKNADAPDSILGLGFGHVEVGTVTPLPQPGNPKPRISRLPDDKAVINRLGFNSKGHSVVANAMNRRSNRSGTIGVNIGANKDSSDFASDYVKGIEKFHDLADYLTINISSPNTPGLRNLQGNNPLTELLNKVGEVRTNLAGNNPKKTPVFLKIAPDLSGSEMDDISKAVAASDIDALIISNTTLSREGLTDRNSNQSGGLSGTPLFQRSTQVLAQMYQRLDGRLPLIGVGGVFNTEDAVSKFEAGATLIQLYTGMIYQGPYLANRILRGLLSHLETNGLDSVSELVGTKSKDWT